MISSAFGMSRREARVVVIGLDNSGKVARLFELFAACNCIAFLVFPQTTLIQHLKPKKVRSILSLPLYLLLIC
jgi:hypothetical protein